MRFLTMLYRKLSIESFSTWVTGYMDNHWDGCLLSFMFQHLPGSKASVLRQMERELERVYGRVLTRIVRKPRCEAHQGKLPIWLACPDLPVPKRKKQCLPDVTLNDGLHIHALALIPPGSRMNERLDQHFAAQQALYVRREHALARHPLARVHAQPIISDPGYVTEYVLKSLMRGRVSTD